MPQSPHAPIRSAAEWSAYLHALCRPVLDPIPFGEDDDKKAAYVRTFRDEFGARGAGPVCLLAWSLGVRADTSGFDDDPDTRLWASLVEQGSTHTEPSGEFETGLVAAEAYAIEHRTLIELSALHALTHLITPPEDAFLSDRLTRLVDWHTRELQPDNGINRPWGIHAFIARSIEVHGVDDAHALDAMLHAQTLAHNCCVTLGSPDLVSALILLDAARWIDARRSSS